MNSVTNFTLGKFFLEIPQGRHEASGHICLTHGRQYSLRLGNHDDRRCDVRVRIDGQVVGCWRIPLGSTIEVERPADDPGRFTFYRLGTAEAVAARLVDGPDLGLIAVTFMPEAIGSWSCIRYSPQRGGTGLSGESSQRFVAVAPLLYDEARFVTIYARLYGEALTARPLAKAAWGSAPISLPDR